MAPGAPAMFRKKASKNNDCGLLTGGIQPDVAQRVAHCAAHDAPHPWRLSHRTRIADRVLRDHVRQRAGDGRKRGLRGAPGASACRLRSPVADPTDGVPQRGRLGGDGRLDLDGLLARSACRSPRVDACPALAGRPPCENDRRTGPSDCGRRADEAGGRTMLATRRFLGCVRSGAARSTG